MMAGMLECEVRNPFRLCLFCRIGKARRQDKGKDPRSGIRKYLPPMHIEPTNELMQSGRMNSINRDMKIWNNLKRAAFVVALLAGTSAMAYAQSSSGTGTGGTSGGSQSMGTGGTSAGGATGGTGDSALGTGSASGSGGTSSGMSGMGGSSTSGTGSSTGGGSSSSTGGSSTR